MSSRDAGPSEVCRSIFWGQHAWQNGPQVSALCKLLQWEKNSFSPACDTSRCRALPRVGTRTPRSARAWHPAPRSPRLRAKPAGVLAGAGPACGCTAAPGKERFGPRQRLTHRPGNQGSQTPDQHAAHALFGPRVWGAHDHVSALTTGSARQLASPAQCPDHGSQCGARNGSVHPMIVSDSPAKLDPSARLTRAMRPPSALHCRGRHVDCLVGGD
jgi:hypothetical protein